MAIPTFGLRRVVREEFGCDLLFYRLYNRRIGGNERIVDRGAPKGEVDCLDERGIVLGCQVAYVVRPAAAVICQFLRPFLPGSVIDAEER